MNDPMPTPATLLRRYAIGASLVVLLIAVYLTTYSGYAISRDEWFLFDATESIARRGDLRQNFEFDAFPPRNASQALPPPADIEPLQPILAAPFLLAAQFLPAIGLAHTVWLFNIVITALTAATLYAYGLALGYRARTAALVGLAFGLGTIAWPYSRTFFREPLFTLLALLSVYLVERIRQHLVAGRYPLLLGLALVAAFAGTLLAKEASLLIIPAIITAAIPARRQTRSTAIALGVLALVGVVLLVVVLNLDTWFDIAITRWNLTDRLQQARSNIYDMSEGVRGYLYSPARSMWLFSPVLLLGFFGWPGLVRARRWREIAVPLVTVVTFIAGYAAVRGPASWYGGLGWGPRYLVPVTPFVALWLLPVAQVLLERSAAWWKRLGAGIVALLSMGIQILAALVPINAYYGTLAAQEPPVVPWLEGAWSLRWSPLYVYAQQIGDHPLDIAWRHADGPVWLLPALAAGLALLAGGWLVWWAWHRDTAHHSTGPRTVGVTFSTLTVATAVALFGSLYAIRQDPRYFGDFAPAHDLLDLLESELRTGDVVVLNDYTYSEFFMNYFKHPDVPVYTLPQSPGERPSPEQVPAVESVFSDELIHLGNTAILNRLTQQHERLWLVINSSPFIGWSTRPVEQYLARHYFAVTERKSTDYARAVVFDTTSAPPQPAPAWPEQRTDAVFGGQLHLSGYDIPDGTTRNAGDILPVSLLWETIVRPQENYTIALLLVRDEQLVAQRDSFPANHFEFTSAWRAGSLHRDNHGVALPPDLPPGDYELWLALYWWQEPSRRLPVTTRNGDPIGDHLVLETIEIVN